MKSDFTGLYPRLVLWLFPQGLLTTPTCCYFFVDALGHTVSHGPRPHPHTCSNTDSDFISRWWSLNYRLFSTYQRCIKSFFYWILLRQYYNESRYETYATTDNRILRYKTIPRQLRGIQSKKQEVIEIVDAVDTHQIPSLSTNYTLCKYVF
jgi:hypothetical protein